MFLLSRMYWEAYIRPVLWLISPFRTIEIIRNSDGYGLFFLPQNQSSWQYFVLFVFFLTTCGCTQEVCMTATQTNIEESKCVTERVNSEQKLWLANTDKELAPNRGIASVAWMRFGYEEPDMDQKTILIYFRPVATTDSNNTNLLYHLFQNQVKQYRVESAGE